VQFIADVGTERSESLSVDAQEGLRLELIKDVAAACHDAGMPVFEQADRGLFNRSDPSATSTVPNGPVPIPVRAPSRALV
jgi:hypothetical protein